MSIHIYENGTEGAQDGTEVQFLHFDGGVMAEGTSKGVTKDFYIRTDGEDIEDVEIMIGAVNDDGTGIYNSYSVFFITNVICNDSQNAIIPDGIAYGVESFVINKLNAKNFKVTIKLSITQSDGESDTRGKLYFNKLSEKLVGETATVQKDINIYTGNVHNGEQDGVCVDLATCKIVHLFNGNYDGRNNFCFAFRCKDGYKTTNTKLSITIKGSYAGGVYVKLVKADGSLSHLANDIGLSPTSLYSYNIGELNDANCIVYISLKPSRATGLNISFSYDELVAIS